MTVILFWSHLVRFELKQSWALSIELQEHITLRIYERGQLDLEISIQIFLNMNYGAVLT